MNEQFAKPVKLEFEGNVAENFRRFSQQFEIYMSASGFDTKEVSKKKQAAILLNLAGEEAIEVYNTFTFDEGGDQDPEVCPGICKYVMRKQQKNVCLVILHH